MTSFLFNVVLGGFEPPQTEPKPVVLPLHHRTMWVQSYNFLQKQPNETAIFLETRNKYAVLRFQKNPFINHLSVFQNILALREAPEHPRSARMFQKALREAQECLKKTSAKRYVNINLCEKAKRGGVVAPSLTSPSQDNSSSFRAARADTCRR